MFINVCLGMARFQTLFHFCICHWLQSCANLLLQTALSYKISLAFLSALALPHFGSLLLINAYCQVGDKCLPPNLRWQAFIHWIVVNIEQFQIDWHNTANAHRRNFESFAKLAEFSTQILSITYFTIMYFTELVYTGNQAMLEDVSDV